MSYVSLIVEYFPDPTKGVPVFNGYIYVGQPDTDPTVVANQIPVVLRQLNGAEVVASQPIRTGAGGVALYNNSPVIMVVDQNYSLTVQNEQGAQVYYVPNSYERFSDVVQWGDVSDTPTSGKVATWDGMNLLLADLAALDGNDGLSARLVGRTSANDGGEGWFAADSSDLSTEVAADTLQGIYIPYASDATGASGAWVRQNVTELSCDWFHDGATLWDTTLQTVIDLGVTLSLPVIFPRLPITEGSIIIRSFSDIRSFNGKGKGAYADEYATLWEHRPSGANVDMLKTDTSITSYGVNIGDGFWLYNNNATAFKSRTGMLLAKVVGLSLGICGCSNGFSVAGMQFCGLQNAVINRPRILNSDTTTACPAGILFNRDFDPISTSTSIYSPYISGVSVATGGIVDGLVCDNDSTLGLNIYNPIIESVSASAFIIEDGNTVDIYSPYTENVPNTDIASGIFRIGKNGVAGIYDTYLNIFAGELYGCNTSSANNFAFDLEVYSNIQVIGSQLGRVSAIQTSVYNSTTAQFTLIDCSYSGAFGTVAYSKNINWINNKGLPPTGSRVAGELANIPTFYLNPGLQYMVTSGGLKRPQFYTGTGWVEADGSIYSSAEPTTGVYVLAQKAWNSTPAGSGTMGWVCTTAGYAVKGEWTTGTAYVTGNYVYYGANIYIAASDGTSGATAPVHVTGTVSDGAVDWLFVAVSAAAAFKTFGAITA